MISFKNNGKIKLMIIVGTRPEIIRLSEVIKKCRKYFDTLLVHTGQNYDYNLNGVFFRDLELDDPDFKKKKKELDKGWKPYRINHLSWWKEELPSEEEMQEGRKNLYKHNNEVDFIVTHCASSSTAALLSQGLYKPDILTGYLEEIRQTVKFKKWFFGHYHDNQNVNEKEILLYEQIIRIW